MYPWIEKLLGIVHALLQKALSTTGELQPRGKQLALLDSVLNRWPVGIICAISSMSSLFYKLNPSTFMDMLSIMMSNVTTLEFENIIFAFPSVFRLFKCWYW